MNDLATSATETQARPRRRRRLRKAMLAVLGLVVLALGIAIPGRLLTYQPLTYGNGYNVPDARVVSTVGLGTDYQFQAKPVGTFDVWVQIKNTGPRAVTVLDVVRDRHYYWRLRDVALGIYGPEPDGNFGREFVAFTPQRLESGEYLQLRLRYEFADCEMESSSSFFKSFQVRYSATLIERVTEIDLPFSVGIKDIGGDCGDDAFRPM